MSSEDGNYYSVATATLQGSGYPMAYGSANNYPSGPSRVVWVKCHLPVTVSGNHSYLASIYLHLTYH